MLKLCDCGHIARADGGTMGYGKDSHGKKFCFACCAEQDRAYMAEHDRITLYLGKEEVTNWPGSLRIGLRHVRHNGNRQYPRTDFWFTFAGKDWHGFQAGDYNNLAHCRVVKTK